MTNLIEGNGPILMVDDSDADLMVAQRCYARSQMSHELILLRSGEDLLEYLDDVERGGRAMPALVLLDINMPTMDGFEALRVLRSRERFQQVPVVVMLTNSDNPEDVERARECGASGFQVKPLRVTEYVQFFDSLVPGGA